MTIEFKGSHFERRVILWGVLWRAAYPISYGQLPEIGDPAREFGEVRILAQRAPKTDHAGRYADSPCTNAVSPM
jgi:hypothetical protein